MVSSASGVIAYPSDKRKMPKQKGPHDVRAYSVPECPLGESTSRVRTLAVILRNHGRRDRLFGLLLDDTRSEIDPDPAHVVMREDLRFDRVVDVRMVDQELLGVLAPLTDPLPAK